MGLLAPTPHGDARQRVDYAPVPLSSEIVGRSGEPLVHTLDARWTMAYAAGLGDANPLYMDSRARPDLLAHPMFPVCYEWPLFLSPRYLPATDDLAPDERLRGVHATHDLRLHRPVRAGMAVKTTATVVAVEARRPGAYQLTRLDTVELDGDAVTTSWYGTLMRGVAVLGGDRALPDLPVLPDAPAGGSSGEDIAIPVAAGAAHVYTECARIWNPIHTDAAVADAAGLPEIILHGTASIALAVSRLVDRVLAGRADAVTRVTARLGAMVPMPSTLTLRILEGTPQATLFDVLNEKGEPAVRNGLLEHRRVEANV